MCHLYFWWSSTSKGQSTSKLQYFMSSHLWTLWHLIILQMKVHQICQFQCINLVDAFSFHCDFDRSNHRLRIFCSFFHVGCRQCLLSCVFDIGDSFSTFILIIWANIGKRIIRIYTLNKIIFKINLHSILNSFVSLFIITWIFCSLELNFSF